MGPEVLVTCRCPVWDGIQLYSYSYSFAPNVARAFAAQASGSARGCGGRHEQEETMTAEAGEPGFN